MLTCCAPLLLPCYTCYALHVCAGGREHGDQPCGLHLAASTCATYPPTSVEWGEHAREEGAQRERERESEGERGRDEESVGERLVGVHVCVCVWGGGLGVVLGRAHTHVGPRAQTKPAPNLPRRVVITTTARLRPLTLLVEPHPDDRGPVLDRSQRGHERAVQLDARRVPPHPRVPAVRTHCLRRGSWSAPVEPHSGVRTSLRTVPRPAHYLCRCWAPTCTMEQGLPSLQGGGRGWVALRRLPCHARDER